MDDSRLFGRRDGPDHPCYTSISCPAAGAFPAFSGGIHVGVEGKANVAVAYGIAAAGTIIPPWIDDFGIFANLDAQLDGILNVNANANVRLPLLPSQMRLTSLL